MSMYMHVSREDRLREMFFSSDSFHKVIDLSVDHVILWHVDLDENKNIILMPYAIMEHI